MHASEAGEAADDAEPDTPATAKASTVQDAEGHWKLRIDLSRIVIPSDEQVCSAGRAGPAHLHQLQLRPCAGQQLWHAVNLPALQTCAGCCPYPSRLDSSLPAEAGVEHSGPGLAAQDGPGGPGRQDHPDTGRVPGQAGPVAGARTECACSA